MLNYKSFQIFFYRLTICSWTASEKLKNLLIHHILRKMFHIKHVCI